MVFYRSEPGMLCGVMMMLMMMMMMMIMMMIHVKSYDRHSLSMFAPPKDRCRWLRLSFFNAYSGNMILVRYCQELFVDMNSENWNDPPQLLSVASIQRGTILCRVSEQAVRPVRPSIPRTSTSNRCLR